MALKIGTYCLSAIEALLDIFYSFNLLLTLEFNREYQSQTDMLMSGITKMKCDISSFYPFEFI